MKAFIDILIRWFFEYEFPELCSKTKVNKKCIMTIQFLVQFFFVQKFKNLIISGSYI